MTFSPIVLGNGLAGFNFLQKTRPVQQALFEDNATIARDANTFRDEIQTIQTSDDLLDNRSLLRVSLGAFGLDEDINNRAFLKQILDSDLSDASSLANRLSDKRYLAFAQAFNFTDENNPGLKNISSEDSIQAQLKDIATPDDLLENRGLLRATLSANGLEKDVDNTYFLKLVLESDVTDPNSFANRLSDVRYAELATAFDFSGKSKELDSVYGFAKTFKDDIDALSTTDDLLENSDLLGASLKLFGLEDDVDRTDFLRSVLDSDTSDNASFVNELDDERYAALSDAFAFGDPTPLASDERTKVQEFVDLISSKTKPANTPTEFFQDIELLLGSMDFFGVPSGAEGSARLGRVLNADQSDPVSAYNLIADQRFVALADGFNFEQPQEGRVYPPEFAENIVQNYIDRQFEVSIGESDPSMRIALAMERELGGVIENNRSNDGRWFSIMASSPLRTVFETAFQLSSAFGTLDVDRQLGELKERSSQVFGTDNVEELFELEKLKEIRERFLFQGVVSGGQTVTGASAASVLLANL